MEYLDCHAFFNFLADDAAAVIHLRQNRIYKAKNDPRMLIAITASKMLPSSFQNSYVLIFSSESEFIGFLAGVTVAQ
jgi:hypothetical protein